MVRIEYADCKDILRLLLNRRMIKTYLVSQDQRWPLIGPGWLVIKDQFLNRLDLYFLIPAFRCISWIVLCRLFRNDQLMGQSILFNPEKTLCLQFSFYLAYVNIM